MLPAEPPLYRPEVRPAEFRCAILKGGYGQRYEATGASEYVGKFCAGVGEEVISRVVKHCDSAADGPVADEPPRS